MQNVPSKTRELVARQDYAKALGVVPPDYDAARCALASLAWEFKCCRKDRVSHVF